MTIGTFSGPEEEQLMAVFDAARLSDGFIAVVDRGARTVRLFDESGGFRLTVGGPGSGPGEFRDPISVLVAEEDEVVVWDGQLYRTTRFDRSGEVSDMKTVDLGQMTEWVDLPLFPAGVELLAGGEFLIQLAEKEGVGGKDGKGAGVKITRSPTEGTRLGSGALRVSGDLSSVDTLKFFADTAKVTVDAPWGPFTLAPPVPEGPELTHGGRPPRICMGDRGVPQVECIDPDGGRLQIRWDPNPEALTRGEIEGWRAGHLRDLGMKLTEEDILAVLDQVPVPLERPSFSDLTLDSQRNLWVRLGPIEGSTESTIRYLVFGPDGSLLGEIRLPPIQVFEIGEDYVLGLFRDDFEVEYVHIYELAKPAGSAGDP
ncbi:MAG: hypothetical protein HKO65_05725 [Gemmatimonadetes bacterium]|nr:hypothetical protein [Gemmatimonadota bacterium]NNM04584.1 hypothetical protein [Gemmatimonadota bacterium]